MLKETFKVKNKILSKKTFIITLLIVASLILTYEFFPFKEKKVYSELIRLHILANSGNEEDIAIKYTVRDAILKESESVFAPCETSAEAKASMEETGKKIEAIANKVLAENGKSYTAHAVWGKETYPKREYDGLSLPAGEYYSLRILLGEAKGENWWCVLFPPLCLGAAKAQESMMDVGIDGESFKTFTDNSVKYKIKFFLLEWLFG
jgi:stage II sporulation protein R